MDKTFSPKFLSCSLLASAAVLAGVSFASTAAVAQCNQTGKVWFVAASTLEPVSFPVPTATPDVTFDWSSDSANFTAYAGNGSKSNCFNVGAFFAKCGSPVQNLEFSGLKNPYLGKKARANTPLFGNGYGAEIELTSGSDCGIGTYNDILHSDGAQIMINGNVVAGVSDTAGGGPAIDITNQDGSTVGTTDWLFGIVESPQIAVGVPNLGNINYP